MLDAGVVYTHSGRLGNGLLLVPIVGVVAAVILAVVYAVVDVYLPIAGYISFILTAAFACGVGFAVSRTGVAANCRSIGFLRIAGLLIGALALYCSWVAFEYVLISRSLPEGESLNPVQLALAPSAVWGIAGEINQEGWYSIRGGHVKGPVLWVFWGLEALIVVGGIAVLAAIGIKDRVFCERCTRWCQEVKDRMRMAVSRDDAIYRRLSNGDLTALADLPLVPRTISPYLRLDVQSCTACPDTATWQVYLVTHERDKKGQLQQKDQMLTRQRLMTSQEQQEIGRLAERPPIEIPSPDESADAGDPAPSEA